MSQTLSNFNISLPFPSSNIQQKLLVSRFPQQLIQRSRFRANNGAIRAMAGEKRDNLDHLQRTPSRPQKRVGSAAPVGLWDRFPTARTVQQMMETMERMMEDQFTYSGKWPSPIPNETSSYSKGRTPWEIKEEEGEYKMRFDMPGMTKDDVKVWVEEKMLVVKAEKAAKKRNINGGENVNASEEEGDWSAKSYGRYSSRIALPENVEFEKIKAEVKDGVLYINIPKASPNAKVLDINVQ